MDVTILNTAEVSVDQTFSYLPPLHTIHTEIVIVEINTSDNFPEKNYALQA